jgi:menaquinone-specific isochorismate synthase
VTAGPGPAPAFHARTVPLEYGPDALQFDGGPTVLFDRPGLTLVGWGTALLVAAADAAAVLAAIPCEDPVRQPGSGVVALGALPFTDALSGTLVVPRFTMGIARDRDGDTRRWATAVGPADVPLPDTDELFDAVIWQYGTTPDDDGVPVPGVVAMSSALPSDGYRAAVAQAVATMEEPGATLRKVVLSRPLALRLAAPLQLAAVLRRLRTAEPTCTVFCMPLPDGSFFGASPELLVARHGPAVSCLPLAGTVARGDTARTDADAQGRLAGSAKDRAEHRYVVDAVAAALRPVCEELIVPPQPSLVAFRSVAHLGTRVAGRLRAPVPVLELVDRLHPTPAVGGTPRADALEAIAEGEPDGRDYWAGPVGWVDAAGDGEWMIGIRSARLQADGTTLTLRAGAGIVAGSDPEAETVETNVKLAAVLDAVVPGASAELR